MLTDTQLAQVGNFDIATVNNLRPAIGGGRDLLSAAGACDVTKYVTELSVSGTVAFTLAAPTVVGDRKRIICVSATSTPVGTLTISSPDDTAGFVLPSTIVFSAAGQLVELIATSNLKWRAIHVDRAGVQTLVIGTTLTAGLVMSHLYACSVTGTVSSTIAAGRGLPNGIAPGDKCIVGCSVAASTPVGNIEFAGLTTANVAATNLAAIGATTDTVNLEWNGSAWLVVGNTGVTVS